MVGQLYDTAARPAGTACHPCLVTLMLGLCVRNVPSLLHPHHRQLGWAFPRRPSRHGQPAPATYPIAATHT
jgi:hypothetical protein